MVQPNWPEDDEPDYTPEFGRSSGTFDDTEPRDLDEVLDELREIARD